MVLFVLGSSSVASRGDSLSWCCLCRQMTIPTTFDSWYDNERFLSFRTELVKPEIIFAIKVGTIDVVTTYLSSDFHSGWKSLYKVAFYNIASEASYVYFLKGIKRYNNVQRNTKVHKGTYIKVQKGTQMYTKAYKGTQMYTKAYKGT